MTETVWDTFWKIQSDIDLNDVIQLDPIFHLIRRLVPFPSGTRMRILEVGCGSGARTLALLKGAGVQDSGAVLVDISPPAIAFTRRCAERNGIRTDILRTDALHLPFPENTFDLVWNEGVNEHFSQGDRQRIFNEMSRVCAPGGTMVVIVPNAWNIPYRLTKKILEGRHTWEYGFEDPFTIFELKRRMRDAGIRPRRSGGAQVLTSVFEFSWLMNGRQSSPKDPSRDTGDHGERRRRRRKYRLSLMQIDVLFERIFGSLLGRDIAVMGVKPGAEEKRST